MTYITHPNIPKDTIEERAYQVAVAESAKKGNTLVVLPTGMGKTAVALLVAAERMDSGKILMVAPTKPLVEQHLQYFRKNLILEEDEVTMITGTTPSAKRVKLFKQARFCVATPEVVRNDLEAGRYSLRDVSLLIIDECHRTVGDYAYVPIAHHYLEEAAFPLLVGMTASPGADKEKVEEICTHMGITQVESRTEDDPDVKPYVHERELSYVSLELPEELWLAVSSMNSMLDERLERMKNLNYPVPRREALSMKAMNMLSGLIKQRMANHDKTAFLAMSLHAELLKLKHGVMLAESQGSTALQAYLNKLQTEGIAGTSKASKRLIKDERFQCIYNMSTNWERELHPKAEEVVRIVQEQLLETPDSKIIVFVTYRDSVQMLVNYLHEAGITAKRFVGQAKRATEKGLSQKEQIEAIKQFREGAYTVLVATSVGEEGLDIPSTDLVVFYEAVPSEVRSIQRKGRTGRNTTGKVIVLVTKGTGDETYRWVSNAKEKKMLRGVTAMRDGAVPKTTTQATIEETVETVQQTLTDAVIQDEQPVTQPIPEEQPVPPPQSQIVTDTPEPPKKKRGRKPKAKIEERKTTDVPEVKPEPIAEPTVKEVPAVPEPQVQPEKKEAPENQLLLKVLMAFPDVTFEMAKELLRTYGSLDAILTASKPELMDVPGMTDKAVTAILWVMKKKWKD